MLLNYIFTYRQVMDLVRDMQKDQDETSSVTSESSIAPSELDDDEDAGNLVHYEGIWIV